MTRIALSSALVLACAFAQGASGDESRPPTKAELERLASAASERAFALASAGADASSSELSETVLVVRRHLERDPASPLSDRLRARLCATRRAAGNLSASNAEPGPPHGAPVTVPVALEQPVPTPPNVLRSRMKGDQRAVIEAVIDSDGCVRGEAVVESTSVEWAGYAMQQVAHWVFRPATLEGRPVAVRYNLAVKYKRR